MCEYCGCRGVLPIAELMDEHTALVNQSHQVRREASGWALVDQAHADSPSFLLDPTENPSLPEQENPCKRNH